MKKRYLLGILVLAAGFLMLRDQPSAPVAGGEAKQHEEIAQNEDSEKSIVEEPIDEYSALKQLKKDEIDRAIAEEPLLRPSVQDYNKLSLEEKRKYLQDIGWNPAMADMTKPELEAEIQRKLTQDTGIQGLKVFLDEEGQINVGMDTEQMNQQEEAQLIRDMNEGNMPQLNDEDREFIARWKNSTMGIENERQ